MNRAIVEAFGVLGWIELSAALLVAVGCLGELWILINKLTLHIEPIARSSGRLWQVMASIDKTVRPILVRLKIGGRKLPEAKEQLLERLFVLLVAFGVAVEFVCLPMSLLEIAHLNETAANAGRQAGEAFQRAGEANEKAGLANDRASKADLERVKLEKVLEEWRRPRTITKEQRETFIELLKGSPKREIPVYYISSDDETRAYTLQIRRLLDEAGYGLAPTKPDRGGFFVYGVTSTNKNANVFMMFGSFTNFPAAELAVAFAFTNIGIAVPYGVDTNSVESEHVTIMVTNKR